MSISKIILASSSPRRKELLNAAGVPFAVFVSNIDETPLKKETPKQMVARLSFLKAETIARQNTADFSQIILAADTTVVSNRGKNLGKPENLEQAKKMMRELQGKPHHVLTAYTLLKTQKNKTLKKITRVVRTDVYIKKMSAKEIETYVNRNESLDKAGAYAAQGFGMALIEKIKGSYTNVVGLPVAQVVDDLKKMGFVL